MNIPSRTSRIPWCWNIWKTFTNTYKEDLKKNTRVYTSWSHSNQVPKWRKNLKVQEVPCSEWLESFLLLFCWTLVRAQSRPEKNHTNVRKSPYPCAGALDTTWLTCQISSTMILRYVLSTTDVCIVMTGN